MFPPHTDPFEATLNAFRHQNLRIPVCSAWFLEVHQRNLHGKNSVMSKNKNKIHTLKFRCFLLIQIPLKQL